MEMGTQISQHSGPGNHEANPSYQILVSSTKNMLEQLQQKIHLAERVHASGMPLSQTHIDNIRYLKSNLIKSQQLLETTPEYVQTGFKEKHNVRSVDNLNAAPLGQVDEQILLIEEEQERDRVSEGKKRLTTSSNAILVHTTTTSRPRSLSSSDTHIPLDKKVNMKTICYSPVTRIMVIFQCILVLLSKENYKRGCPVGKQLPSREEEHITCIVMKF